MEPVLAELPTGPSPAWRYPESMLALRSRRFSLSDFDVHTEPLGEGKFGTAYRVRERATRTVCVLKSVEKDAILDAGLQHQMRREVELHCRLCHPNIIRMYAYFHDAERAYILLEYANGGNLYTKLSNISSRRVSDACAAEYTRQLCEALVYLHARNVIHRDIKPENLLLHTPKGGVESLKLCDFGWAVAQRKESRRETLCGTVEYLPPEVAAGKEYSFGFDMWTVGVLVYEMLVGSSPFVRTGVDATEDQQGIIDRIQTCSFRVPAYVSADARDLISRLLLLDQHARLSAANVLKHPWITKRRK